MSIGDPSRPSRFRPEATAQSKIIRFFMGRGETVQWEVAPKPDSQYAPDVADPNEPNDPPDPPATNWRIDLITHQQDILELHRWSKAGWNNQTNDYNVQRVTAARVQAYIQSAKAIGITQVWPNNALSTPWAFSYTDDRNTSWCVWGDPDYQQHSGSAYFAPSSDLPTPAIVQACGGTGQPPPTTVTTQNPLENQHICWPCEVAFDAAGHALAHYLVRYVTFQGSPTYTIAPDVQADANGNISFSVNTMPWTFHDQLGMVIFDETSPQQVTDAIDTYVTADC